VCGGTHSGATNVIAIIRMDEIKLNCFEVTFDRKIFRLYGYL